MINNGSKKSIELYKGAKPRNNDITTEEYLLRRFKDDYTFKPSILSGSIKRNSKQEAIKGEDKAINRIRESNKVLFYIKLGERNNKKFNLQKSQ